MAFTAWKLETHKCAVQTLDGDEIQCLVTNLTTGGELLQYVCRKVGIAEFDYFGLQYLHHGDKKLTWLQLGKFLGRQLREEVYELYLCVKHWPPSPYLLQDDITRYYFVLQVRQKLLSKQMVCAKPVHALLAAYIAQAEFGDYDAVADDENYLKDFQVMPDQSNDFVSSIREFHKKHRDLKPTDAEFLYLENARKIPLYGMELHEAFDGDGRAVALGVNCEGIHVMQLGAVLNKFTWANMVSISKKRRGNKFFLNTRVVEESAYEDVAVGFVLATWTDVKRLFRACRDQLLFYSKRGCPAENCIGNHEKINNCVTAPCEGSHGRPQPEFSRISSVRFTKRFKLKALTASRPQPTVESTVNSAGAHRLSEQTPASVVSRKASEKSEDLHKNDKTSPEGMDLKKRHRHSREVGEGEHLHKHRQRPKSSEFSGDHGRPISADSTGNVAEIERKLRSHRRASDDAETGNRKSTKKIRSLSKDSDGLASPDLPQGVSSCSASVSPANGSDFKARQPSHHVCDPELEANHRPGKVEADMELFGGAPPDSLHADNESSKQLISAGFHPVSLRIALGPTSTSPIGRVDAVHADRGSAVSQDAPVLFSPVNTPDDGKAVVETREKEIGVVAQVKSIIKTTHSEKSVSTPDEVRAFPDKVGFPEPVHFDLPVSTTTDAKPPIFNVVSVTLHGADA